MKTFGHYVVPRAGGLDTARGTPPATRHHERGAFTLIELLVVIAIIAILASILVPAVSSALDRARTISCCNNMRQIGIAMYAYVADHDSEVPTGYYDYNCRDSYDDQLSPYLGPFKFSEWEDGGPIGYPVFFDPVDTTRRWEDTWQSGGACKNQRPRSYSVVRAANNYSPRPPYPANGNGGIFNQGMTIDDVPLPMGTIYVTERFDTYSWQSYEAVANIDRESIRTPPHDELTKANYLQLDGHVVTLKPIDTIGQKGTLARPRGMWTLYEKD